MDIKQNSTMIIALAIAVVVVMSVMVPIISDTMDNAGSGGGGSNNSYVNEGSMYMKSKNSMANDEVHFLSFINTGSKIEFRIDGDIYTEKNITGTDFWNYPIIIQSETTTENGSESNRYTLLSFERGLENNPVISANTFNSKTTAYERWVEWDTNQIAFDLTDTEIEIVEFQFHANGMSVLVNTESEGQDVPYDMFLMTDGDWVVAENPVVNPDQKIYSLGERRGTSNGITYSAYTYGYGQASYFTDFYYDAEIGYGIDPSDEESKIRGFVQDDANINVELTDTDYGVRLGTVNYKGDWYTDPNEDPLFSTDESFNTYIVPKVVTVHNGETQAGWLTSQLPSEPITITCKEIETGKMAVYYNYDYSYNAENTPIYVQDMTENPILVLAIGDKWACYVSSLPSDYDDPYHHDTGLIHGVSTYSTWLGIGTNGTIAYKNSIEIEGQTYTRDGLIAYISPNGDMKPYYNENVPKSSEVYTYMSSITMSETENISIGAILRNGYTDPTVFAGGDYYDGSVHEVDVSAEYIIDGDYITGLKVTAGLPSGTEVNTISLASQTPPITPNDGDMPQGTFAFSVVPSGTEETSGGGSGGLSPTLIAVLSAIPIMVLVGLTMMVIRSMKA